MKKKFDQTFEKGAVYDDDIMQIIREINHISHKPTEEEKGIVAGDVGELSYYTILRKKIRLVLYVEE